MRSIVLVLLFLAAMVAFTQDGAAQTTSPHGFVRDWCTWYTDFREYDLGWNLQFAPSSNRAACNWANVITNARCIGRPTSGAIMVIGPWNGNGLVLKQANAGGVWGGVLTA
jgi:hypothetical protein